ARRAPGASRNRCHRRSRRFTRGRDWNEFGFRHPRRESTGLPARDNRHLERKDSMPSATLNDCTQLDATLLERVNYFPRQLLTADDMIADQQYFIAKMRRHNRYLHGWGVVCGLGVTIAPTAKSPWIVQISPGYALGPYGDEIYVPNPVNLDLAQC